MGEIVTIGQTRAQKHSADVHVVSNVRALHLLQGHSEITFEDLDGHGRLLLADARKPLEALSEFSSGRDVTPDPSGITLVVVEHDARRFHHPSRRLIREPMERLPPFPTAKRLSDPVAVFHEELGREPAEPESQLPRRLPGTLGGDLIVAHHRDEEGKRVLDDEPVGFRVRSEPWGWAILGFVPEGFTVGEERFDDPPPQIRCI
ncbi:MAG TPA: hypothetical protein ENK55_10615, partial [Actinobacteria bacterium]|nr:hypothetical protein [Actinomycetota bacterium]